MESLGVTPNMTIIDLCCGDGYFTIPLAKLVTKVYGLEFDSNLLEQASQYCLENGVTNCQWILGDALEVASLVPEKMDFVLMASTFHGIPDKVEMLHVIFELLKPKGKFAVINWHSRPREETIVLGLPRGPKTEMRISPQILSDMLVSSGFILERTMDISSYHYVCIFEKS
jgi:ubiquinone/menaquinone biosynthesis C-methylase UbiE